MVKDNDMHCDGTNQETYLIRLNCLLLAIAQLPIHTGVEANSKDRQMRPRFVEVIVKVFIPLSNERKI